MWENNADRGQAYTYVLAGATIVMVAGIIAVMNQPVDMLLNQSADICQTAQCNTGRGHIENMWTWLSLVTALFVLLMVVSASVFKSRRP